MIDAPLILASPYPSLERARVLGSHIVMAGLAADRPPAGQAGRLYFETDTGGGTLFRDSGSSWVQVAPDVSSQVLRKVATGQQNKTNTATLGIDTTLTVTLEANTNYALSAALFFTSDPGGGGVQADLGGGSATMTVLSYNGFLTTNVGAALVPVSGTPITSLTTLYLNDGTAGETYSVYLYGGLRTNVAGTFTLRFAQQTAGGPGTAASRLAGSSLVLVRV